MTKQQKQSLQDLEALAEQTLAAFGITVQKVEQDDMHPGLIYRQGNKVMGAITWLDGMNLGSKANVTDRNLIRAHAAAFYAIHQKSN